MAKYVEQRTTKGPKADSYEEIEEEMRRRGIRVNQPTRAKEVEEELKRHAHNAREVGRFLRRLAK